jgi:hypothetical protein
MRKIFLKLTILVATSGSLSLVSCKKKTDTPPSPVVENKDTTQTATPNADANKWTVGSQSFTGIAGSPVWNGGGNSWGFMGNGSLDSLVAFQVWFHKTSPRSGVYPVEAYLTKKPGDSTVVSVNVSLGNNAYYSKKGGTVTVTNTNGVISATVKDVVCSKSLLGTGDTVVVAGNLTK